MDRSPSAALAPRDKSESEFISRVDDQTHERVGYKRADAGSVVAITPLTTARTLRNPVLALPSRFEPRAILKLSPWTHGERWLLPILTSLPTLSGV